MTLAELVARTARRFAAARLHYGHGTANPRDEAAYLVLRGLDLPFDADLKKEAHDFKRIERLIERRIRERIPVAYLLNEAWLNGLSFYVDRRVIVPRSHIAYLLGEPWLRRAVKRVLDLCTGSGCLAILAARAFPGARVDASDISADALAVARKNVARHRLRARVRMVRSDLFSALKGERYDLIVANPPYVTGRSMKALPREYRHEPGMALAGGSNGLEFVSRILASAAAHLEARGMLVCEVGANRKSLERAYPRLPLMWPRDEVFVLERSQLTDLE